MSVESTLHKIPVLGGLFGNPEADKKIAALKKLAAAYQARRPEMAQAQTNALNQSLGAYTPANNMLGQMYGQGAMVDLNALGQNPMPAGFTDPYKPPPTQTSIDRYTALNKAFPGILPKGGA